MHLYMNAHTHTPNVQVRVASYSNFTPLHPPNVGAHIRQAAGIYTCICNIHTYIYICIDRYRYVYLCIYIHIHVFVYMFMYIYICIAGTHIRLLRISARCSLEDESKCTHISCQLQSQLYIHVLVSIFVTPKIYTFLFLSLRFYFCHA